VEAVTGPAVLVMLVVRLVATTAATEPAPVDDEQMTAAQEQFDRGVTRYEAGDLAEALAAFQRAYELEPHPHLHYNIGVVQLDMGEHAAATRSLTRYLEEGGATVDPQRRSEVESRLEALAPKIGRLTVRCNVEGAEVRVDGELVGTTPLADTLVVDPGTRRVEVTAAGYLRSVESIALAGGQELTLSAVLVQRPAATQPTRDTNTDARTRRGLEISTFVTLGLTVATGAGAIATGVLALRADDDLERELNTYPADPAAVADARERRDTLVPATDGLIAATAVLGVATIATGVVALLLRKRDRTARLRAEPCAGLAIRF
jgi:tetratricopeptide (TPR) repeat protein